MWALTKQGDSKKQHKKQGDPRGQILEKSQKFNKAFRGKNGPKLYSKNIYDMNFYKRNLEWSFSGTPSANVEDITLP